MSELNDTIIYEVQERALSQTQLFDNILAPGLYFTIGKALQIFFSEVIFLNFCENLFKFNYQAAFKNIGNLALLSGHLSLKSFFFFFGLLSLYEK
jgi:hypothetical protein